MSILRTFILRLTICFIGFSVSVNGACEFSPQWTGRWFQSGMSSSIEITSTYIDKKGSCVEFDGDRYVIEDKADNCFRCVIINLKHPNVIQYKESNCMQKADMDYLCETIQGDAPLYSMYRVDGKGVACPFKGGPPFSFTYNKGSGECRHPVSRADACTDASRMMLRYQACPDIRNSESTVEELTCFGYWRDGSTKYMIGKLDHKIMISTDEERYRCFVYTTSGDSIDIAQSGDATCNGIPSATEGSRTMKLKLINNTFNGENNCKFPPWLTEHQGWHLLDHSKTYKFIAHNGTLVVTSIQDGEVVDEMRAVCNSILEQSDGQLMISVHITIGCDSGYRCMKIYKRNNHVIEIQQSSKEVQNSEDACYSFNSQSLPYTTLITTKLLDHPCPFVGRYTVSNNNEVYKMAASTNQIKENFQEEKPPCENEKQMLSLGCNVGHIMEFKSECNSDVTAAYSCHGHWTDTNGTSFLIVLPSLRSPLLPADKYCFVIYGTPETAGARPRRLQLYSLTKTCRRDLQLDSSDPHWMFNITHHDDCGPRSSGISYRLSRLLLITFIWLNVFR